LDGLIQITRADREDAPQLLLPLRERALCERYLAVVDAHGDGAAPFEPLHVEE
jgi:hypothetical protein